MHHEKSQNTTEKKFKKLSFKKWHYMKRQASNFVISTSGTAFGHYTAPAKSFWKF